LSFGDEVRDARSDDHRPFELNPALWETCTTEPEIVPVTFRAILAVGRDQCALV